MHTVTSPDQAAASHSLDWHGLSPDAVLAKLRASATGIDGIEAEARLRIHGPNLISTRRGQSLDAPAWVAATAAGAIVFMIVGFEKFIRRRTSRSSVA